MLQENGIAYTGYSFPEEAPEPDERTMGAAVMHMDAGCEMVIGVGSGVINDTGKILAALSGKPYMIVATAPSMDGYAAHDFPNHKGCSGQVCFISSGLGSGSIE